MNKKVIIMNEESNKKFTYTWKSDKNLCELSSGKWHCEETNTIVEKDSCLSADLDNARVQDLIQYETETYSVISILNPR